MKQFKRLLSVLLCLALVCAMLPLSAAAEDAADGQLLFKYNDTELCEMSRFPTDIDTNHELYFYHGTADSNEAVATIASSDTNVVTLSGGTNGCYHVYIASAGTTTLTYTVGTAEYSVDVTVSESSGEDAGGGGPTTLAMTAYYYSMGPDGAVADGTSYSAGLEASCPDTFFLEFKAGDTTVTSLENSNPEAVQVSDSGTAGVMKVEMLAAGTAVLNATVNDVAYMFVITVTESSGSGGDSGDTGDTGSTGQLYYTYNSDGSDKKSLSTLVLTAGGANAEIYLYGGTPDAPIHMEGGTLTCSDETIVSFVIPPTGHDYALAPQKAGSVTLTYTMADGTVYSAVVTVTDSNSDGDDGNSGGETGDILTATPGEYIFSEGTWTPYDTTYSDSFTITFRDESTDYFQFKVGDTLVTDKPVCSDEGFASVMEGSAENGVWGVNMHDPGTVTLSAVVDGTTYTITVNIVDGSSGGDSGDTTIEPGLKYRYMDWNGSNHFENLDYPLESTWSTGIGYGSPVKFYFFDGANETEVVLSDLVFSSHVSGSQPDGQDYIDLRAENFGTGSISYTVNGETYSIPVTVTLRDFAFYSTENATEASYLESLKVTGEADVFYFVANGGTLTDVTLLDEFANIAFAEKVSDTCWKITVAGTPNGNYYSIQCSGVYEWGYEFSGRYESVQIVDAKPGLKFRYMNYDGSAWYEDTTQALNSEWSSGIGYGNCVKFYFFDGTNETEVALSDLVFSSHVSGSQPSGQDYIDLRAENFGTGSISYTVNGETYSIPVTVSLPAHGFYSSEVASEETYLSSFEVTEESDTFYFIASGGCLTDVTLESASEEIADAVQISDTCWKITITGSVDRVWISLTYAGTDEWNNPFSGWGNGIQVIGKSGSSSGGDDSGDTGDDSTNVLTATAGNYIMDGESWAPSNDTYAGSAELEYSTGGTYFFQFKAGETLITSGLTSKNTDIATVGLTGVTESDGVWGVNMHSGGVVTLNAVVDGVTYSFTITITGYYEDDGTTNVTPVVTVNGVEYTIGMGDAKSNNYDSITFLGTGMTLGCHPGMIYFIAAMSGAGTTGMTEAPAYVYQYIKDVSVKLLSYTNMDASGDQSTPNCSYTTSTMSYHGATVPTIIVDAADGDYFVSKIQVTVTVQGPDDSEPVTYNWVSKISYAESLDLNIDAANVSTADDLNKILASDEAFYGWLEATYPEEYQKLVAAEENNIEAGIQLMLPAVAYDKVIVVNVSDKRASISFFGDRGETGTTMPGMRISGTVGAVWNINFVAQGSCTQTYEGESFTCGILVAGNSNHAHILQVEHSMFMGFDYAVRSTDDGIATGVYGCEIVDCGVGFYMDSYDTSMSQLYGTIKDTCFVNNDIAVQIVSIHHGISPYVIRVNDCDFISNGIDFDVENPGIFYFYRNYYGEFIDPDGELSVDNVKYRTALARYDYAENDTVVVTNPRRIAPCTFGPEDDRLCIDPTPGLYTVILNGMADELVIDGESLEDMEEEAEITVSDEKEEEMGKWKFKDKKGHE